jgi:hypothetical protein
MEQFSKGGSVPSFPRDPNLLNEYNGDETWLYLDDPRTYMWIMPMLRGMLQFDAQLRPRSPCFRSIFLGRVLVRW